MAVAALAAALPYAGARDAGQLNAGPLNAGPLDPARFAAIRQYIREQLDKDALPSLAVAVAKDGRIVWEEGFGRADREKRLPANEHTPYSLASLSKPITTTGLMVLVSQGKIDLDKPANDYLGSARLVARVGNATEATVRRVADHTAGLPLHYQFFYGDEPWRRPSMDETLLRYGNLINAPGERYEYSNLGYGVLDYVIERVSGQSYAEFMRREVFLPLGLTRTAVDIPTAVAPYAATRYGRDGLPIPLYDFDHPGGSAVYSSAHDLVRFGMFHLKNRLTGARPILDDAAIDEMHRPTGGVKDGNGYGIGFDNRERHGYRVVSHTGGMGGVSTAMWLVPEANLAIVALANASTGLPHQVADRIAAELLANWKLPDPQEKRERPKLAPFETPADLAGQWSGSLHTHQGEVPITLAFRPDGQVHARLAEQMVALVNDPRFSDGRFRGRFIGRIGTEDTERFDYVVALNLTLRGSVLNGAATATGGNTGHRDPRVRNALSHWVTLTKQRVEDKAATPVGPGAG